MQSQSMEDLTVWIGMKRSELQRLAKKAGIKANKKTDKIIKELKVFYNQSELFPNANSQSSSSEGLSAEESTEYTSSSNDELSAVEPHHCDSPKQPAAKKTAQRGRKGRKKAKVSTKVAKSPDHVDNSNKKATPSEDDCGPVRRTTRSRSVTPKTGNSVITTLTSDDKKHESNMSATNRPLRRTRSVTTAVATPEKTAHESPVLHRTFEIDPADGSEGNEPQDEVTIKSDPEMKKSIMADLERVAVEKLQSKIPKPKIGVSKANKPITPGNKDWNRIHQATFNKMESIDAYLERKRKRTDHLSVSVKKAKIVADEAKSAVQTLASHRTPSRSATKGGRIVKPISRLRSTNLSFLSPEPSITQPSKKKAVTFKVSRLKTPTRASALLGGEAVSQPRPMRKSTPGPTRKSVSNINSISEKPLLDVSLYEPGKRKSLGASLTPFKFGQAAPVTPSHTGGKHVFNLKASLSKPLHYKPHTGKVKPLEVSTCYKTKTNVQTAKANLKKPVLKTRDDRRATAKQNRAGKRAGDLMARRGIKV